MDINLHGATIALSNHGVTTLKRARGARLVAVTGSLWITQDGDRRDYFLDAGEDLDVTTGGAVVVQAQGDARFAVLRPSTLLRLGDRSGAAGVGSTVGSFARIAALRAI